MQTIETYTLSSSAKLSSMEATIKTDGVPLSDMPGILLLIDHDRIMDFATTNKTIVTTNSSSAAAVFVSGVSIGDGGGGFGRALSSRRKTMETATTTTKTTRNNMTTLVATQTPVFGSIIHPLSISLSLSIALLSAVQG